LRIPVTDGVSLAARHWSGADTGTPFLLVHGLASNARMWDGVGARLAAAGHRVVAIDQRGHGQSDKPDDGYDFATLTADLVAVADALELPQFAAAGQSWGGNVVLELAARHPDRLRGVACVDGGTIELSRHFDTWDAVATAMAPPELIGTPYDDIEAGVRRMHADWPESGIQGALANFEVRDDNTVAPWLTRDRHMAILRELWQHRPSALYPKLRVPVLLVAASDRFALDEAAGAIRRVRAVRLAGHHDLHAQQPDAVAGLLLGALDDGFFA
jgi:pimeloyl-ACP methyl ester carboxylesterase